MELCLFLLSYAAKSNNTVWIVLLSEAIANSRRHSFHMFCPLFCLFVSVVSFSPFWFHSSFALCTLPSEVCSLWLWIVFPWLSDTFFELCRCLLFMALANVFHAQRDQFRPSFSPVGFQDWFCWQSELFCDVPGPQKFCIKQIAVQKPSTLRRNNAAG
jgi:hypothetical protein